MNFPDNIFKAYDIRGLIEGELSPELAYRLGRAFIVFLREKGENLKEKSIVVGFDMRPSSQEYYKEVIRGITDEGMDVVNIGMTSTPIFNFTCADTAEFAGGIMVTASHNPAPYNGFKLTMSDGMPIGKNTGMDRLKELVRSSDFLVPTHKGTVRQKDALAAYVTKIFSFVDISSFKPLKIVLDGGNGMGNVSFPVWLKQLPLEVEYLYMEPDGTFPNHEANPLNRETLRDLQNKVMETGADFGFALDGDADRIGVVDETGEVIEASYIGALLGLEVLKQHAGIHMLYDLRSSMIQRDLWEAQGATTQKCMVGHALIKKMMRETGAHFASELSLHIFYGDLYNLESSDLSLLYFLQMLSRENKPLSEVVAPLKKYFHSGEINFETEKKDAVMKQVEEQYRTEAKEILFLDGLWMQFDWGWLSLRKSNTEPVLRLNVEATSEDKMRHMVEQIQEYVK